MKAIHSLRCYPYVIHKCVSVFDASGRFSPSYDDSSTMTLKADMLICAIGQALSCDVVCDECGLVEIRGNVFRASYSGNTQTPWIFAGGDCVSGPDSVVSGVNRGKQAASSIDRYLGGDGQVIDRKTLKRELTKPVDETKADREVMPILSPDERKSCFCEVEKGFSAEQVEKEAGRCLRCDVLKINIL